MEGAGCVVQLIHEAQCSAPQLGERQTHAAAAQYAAHSNAIYLHKTPLKQGEWRQSTNSKQAQKQWTESWKQSAPESGEWRYSTNSRPATAAATAARVSGWLFHLLQQQRAGQTATGVHAPMSGSVPPGDLDRCTQHPLQRPVKAVLKVERQRLPPALALLGTQPS